MRGAADFTNDSEGAATAVETSTVVGVDATGAFFVVAPVAVAVFSTCPASTSLCVTVCVGPGQVVVDADGARLAGVHG